MYPNPQSNMSMHTPDSPFHPSPGPPPRNMTPGNFHQRTDHTQMWLQSHPERTPYHQGLSSGAPSVMSTMTRMSGMSAISINTQATGMSSFPSNQHLNFPHGPLSSGSHSENIDPKQDLVGRTGEMIQLLLDDDNDVRRTASQLIRQFPKSLKDRNPELSAELIPQLIDAAVSALQKEKDPVIQFYLCDGLAEIVRAFPAISNNIVIEQRRNGTSREANKLLTILMDFANHCETAVEQKLLRHLFPAFHTLFLGNAHDIALNAARSTKILPFMCNHVITSCEAVTKGYIGSIKVINLYVVSIKAQIKKCLSSKHFVVDRGLHIALLRILDYLIVHRHQVDPNFIRRLHAPIVNLFNTLVAVSQDSVGLVDVIVRSGLIQTFLRSRIAFENFISPVTVLETYECLGSVCDSKEIMGVPIFLLPIHDPQRPISIPEVIAREMENALKQQNINLIRAIIRVECNASRIPGFSREAILKYQHQQILHCLIGAVDAWRVQNSPKNDDVDNCLLILQRLVEVDSNLLHQVCEDFFSPQICLYVVTILEKRNSQYISRILRLWSKFAKFKPEKFLKYSEVNPRASASLILLQLVGIYLNQLTQDKMSRNIVKLAVEIYRLLLKSFAMKQEIIHSAQSFNLFELICKQQDLEMILLLMTLIHDIWSSSVELKNLFGASMREMLESFRNSTNIELSKEAGNMLSLIEMDADELVPPLANAFAFNNGY